ncbi:MAG: hypothetical protein ABIA67_00515 [Candidatus Margulisiibacteriota bacterium]
MFLRSSKYISVILLLVVLFVFFGATICQANNYKPCCPEQSNDCPMIFLQEAPKTVNLKTINTAPVQLFVSSISDLTEIDPDQEFPADCPDDPSLLEPLREAELCHPSNPPPAQ